MAEGDDRGGQGGPAVSGDGPIVALAIGSAVVAVAVGELVLWVGRRKR